jgi:shikimate dehydrogenase
MESAICEEPKGWCLQVILAGVLGSPISHSLSPLLHKTAYELLGIEGSYSAFEVQSGQLRHFLNSEGSALNNVSLTMPLKEEALSIADSVSDLAQQIRSGNTLFKKDGLWSLTSTDVAGFTFALESHNRNTMGNVLIIGAGATARAVIASCDGVSRSVSVINRNPDREIAIRNSAPHLVVDFISWGTSINFNKYDLVINTTPGNTAALFVDQVTATSATFFEVLYNPWPTLLLSKWRESGGYGIDGLDLLIHQAISQIEIFTSSSIDRVSVAKMLRLVGEKALG